MKLFGTALICLVSAVLMAQTKKEIVLEDIWKSNTFRQDFVFGFRSMQDGEHYSEIDKDKKLVKVKFEDGSVADTLLNLNTIAYNGKTLTIDDYEFNQDESKLLLFTESENIYRRSVLHKVYVYDLKTKEVVQVHEKKVLHASFSPESDKVAYVVDNNLYYVDLTQEEIVAVTNDGNYNVINGNCDWVYEEEFEFTKAYEWSRDGDYIAYYSFDQTDVPEYNFAIFDKLYPTDYKYKYPKAGEKNSDVQIHIYHLRNGRTVTCDLGEEKDMYIPRIKINPFDNSLVVYRLNRLQNQLDLLSIHANTGKASVMYSESNKYYVEINDNISFLKTKNAFVYTSEKDGYNHIYIHDINTNSSKQLTSGNWEVTEIKGVDEGSDRIYFMSTEKSPLERQLYSLNLSSGSKQCMTPEEGWHEITFGENYKYYLEKYSYLNQPPTYSLVNSDSKKRMLKNNASLIQKMSEYDLSKQELIQVPNEQGELLNGWILKPSSFSKDKKYPLLMFQYSGPGSQQVTNQFGGRDYWWYQMLAQKGYVIVCVDATGTGYRGEEFKKKTYLQLGKYESDDQIAVAKYFAKQNYIDASRIGIWGWSYGGFMSSICLLKGSDVFKMAMAVAPVTNWRYYDNIYTERYMRTPQENPKGYDDNSPVNMVEKLKGKYLLIHGTADDNVHYQNAIEMQKALINANKDFDSEAYPNKNHGISGGVTRLQLYRKMTNFILTNL
jgi:dipeptidyl-peptidase-4